VVGVLDGRVKRRAVQWRLVLEKLCLRAGCVMWMKILRLVHYTTSALVTASDSMRACSSAHRPASVQKDVR